MFKFLGTPTEKGLLFTVGLLFPSGREYDRTCDFGGPLEIVLETSGPGWGP